MRSRRSFLATTAGLALTPFVARAGDPPRIIVSGFGPFAGRPVNASSMLAKAIVARNPKWNARAIEIPVLWGEPAKVLAEVSTPPWGVWLAFGEGGPGSLAIETLAHNARGKGQDVEHQTAPKPVIHEGGPAELRLGIDAEALARKLTRLGVTTRVSSSAGKYLCEEMLYTLLLAQQQLEHRGVIFIHIPPFGTTLKTGPAPDASIPFDEVAINHVADVISLELLKAVHVW